MNRTQRAVKKSLHRTFSQVKKEKHSALNELSCATWDYGSKSDAVKSKVKQEKGLKRWHREIVRDYAGTKNKEVKTA